MHKFFPEWYRIVSIELSAGLLEKRWSGVENFVKGMTQSSALDMVRLYHSKNPINDSFVEEYCSVFQGIDPLFPMRENAVELQVLAGAAIVECIEKDHGLSTIVAYATVCPNFQRLGPEVLNADIIQIAREYLTREAINIRAMTKTPKIQSSPLKAELKKALTDALSSNNLPNASPHIMAVLENIDESFKQLMQSANKSIDIFSDSLLVHDEQANILWWLLGEYSNDLNCHFAKIDFPSVCLVAAKELADLTKLLPGPFSAEAFLSKIIHMGRKKAPKEVTLKDAINKSSLPWKEKWLKTKRFDLTEDLCPLYYAAKESVSTGNSAAWEAAFENKSKISADKPIQPEKLALQAYHESLFIESLSE